MAASPPGRRTGSRCPARAKPPGRRRGSRRPRPCRRRRSRCRRRSPPRRGRARRARRGRPPGGRGGAARRAARPPRARARRRWRGSPGAGRGRRPRARPRTGARSARALAEGAQRLPVLQIADVVADPGAAPLATQDVLLSSAPQASSGLGRDRQGRRSPAPSRASGASAAAAAAGERAHHRVVDARLDRAVVDQEQRRRSGRGARRASSSRYAMGSSERLPLVITSGAPASASSRWCSGE